MKIARILREARRLVEPTLTSILLSIVLVSGAKAATIERIVLQTAGGPREFLLATPARVALAKQPLVILLHGRGGSAAQLLGREGTASPLSVFLQIADREGLLIAAPDGTAGGDGQRGWSDCRAETVNHAGKDDVGLVGAIIDEAIAKHGADPSRIFVVGMSNGGMLAYRLAAEIGSRLAGFAAISAAMAARSLCQAPSVALSALVVSGTKDPIVPFGGGQVHILSFSLRGAVLGVEQSAATFRVLARLPDEPSIRVGLPAADHAGATRVTKFVWGSDATRPQVELLRIEGGGHAEPSPSQRYSRLYSWFVGPQNADVEIAEEAWSFFRDKRASSTRH